jgi:hypothetical protein
MGIKLLHYKGCRKTNPLYFASRRGSNYFFEKICQDCIHAMQKKDSMQKDLELKQKPFPKEIMIQISLIRRFNELL